MPCQQHPPVHTCMGPGNAAHLMCAPCKDAISCNTSNIRARRDSIALKAIQGHSGSELQKAWNARVDTILSELYLECYVQSVQASGSRQEDPGWAFCVSGSSAREEASPYSDLDCFILVKEASPARVAIHLNAAERMRDMLRGMGEDGNAASLGLRFCWGGLNPIGLGVDSSPRLIDTPARLAALIENAKINKHIRQGLSESRFICGQKALHEDYLRETEARRGTWLSLLSWGSPMLPAEKKKGLELIKSAANKRLPDMTATVDIKTDFYRLAQFMLAGLAAYYGERDTNSFRIVSALQHRGILGQNSVNAFKQVLETVALFRTMAHLDLGREADGLAPPGSAPDPNVTKLNAKEWRDLQICTLNLSALQRRAAAFVDAKNTLHEAGQSNPFAV